MKKRTTEIDWEDLRFFVELARRGSLSATARNLGVTHATVGRRVAALAAALGAELFDRRRGGYAVTDAGARILAAAGRMEAAAAEIDRGIGETGELSGTVRLTTTDGLAQQVIAPRLGEFVHAHPAIELELVIDSRPLSLARRDADLALRWARPRAGELFARRVAIVTFDLFASRHCPVAPPPLIAYDESFAELPESRWLRQLFPTRRPRLRCSTTGSLFEAVRGGTGAAVLPIYSLRCGPELVHVAHDGPPLTRDLWLIVHREQRAVPRIRAVGDFLTAVIADALGDAEAQAAARKPTAASTPPG